MVEFFVFLKLHLLFGKSVVCLFVTVLLEIKFEPDKSFNFLFSEPSAPHDLKVTANNVGNNVTVKFYTPRHNNGVPKKFIVSSTQSF